MKNGSDYENFVLKIQSAILQSEEMGLGHKNINVEKNKILIDSNGCKREFDIFWEYEIGGFTYTTVIECKNYKNKVSIEKIDALLGKLQDFPSFKPVFATTLGYQQGAVQKAKSHGIELLIVRKQNDTDWQDEEGNPFIKSMLLKLTCIHPPRIIAFTPYVCREWAKENYSQDCGGFTLSDDTDKIFIYDKKLGIKYSLHELERDLGNFAKGIGRQTYCRNFSDAYLIAEGKTIKITGYNVEFYISKPITEELYFDFSKKLLGVVEYLLQKKSIMVFDDKICKK